MAAETWQVLVIDDEAGQREQVRQLLDGPQYGGKGCSFIGCGDFDEAERYLAERAIDLVVLDIRLGNAQVSDPSQQAGIQAFQRIKAYQFVPVIFRSNVSHDAPPSREPWVSVVPKDEGVTALGAKIKSVLESGLPSLQRLFNDHVRGVARTTLWQWAESQSSAPAPGADGAELAYFLMRHLARSLESETVGRLINDLGSSWNANLAHPSQYYLRPPVGKWPMAGDVFRRADGRYFILVTPTCDVAQNKAEMYVFVEATAAIDYFAPGLGSVNALSKNKTDAIRELVKNGKPRYHFLPEASGMPALVIDLQKIQTELRSLVDQPGTVWERIASLDSPFAQALTARFTSYFSRVGTPDLDANAITEAIATQVAARVQVAPTTQGHLPSTP